MSPTQKVTGESTAATTKAHIEAPKNDRLEQKKLFGLMDMDPALTPFERLKTCHALQFTQGSNVLLILSLSSFCLRPNPSISHPSSQSSPPSSLFRQRQTAKRRSMRSL